MQVDSLLKSASQAWDPVNLTMIQPFLTSVQSKKKWVDDAVQGAIARLGSWWNKLPRPTVTSPTALNSGCRKCQRNGHGRVTAATAVGLTVGRKPRPRRARAVGWRCGAPRWNNRCRN